MRRLHLLLCMLLLVSRCASAEFLWIPEDTQRIEAAAFDGCAALGIVYVPAACEVAADAFPAGTVIVRRGSFNASPTLRSLSDAQIEALTNGTPAEMRAAIRTIADAQALLKCLFPSVNCRTNASSETEDGVLRLHFPAPELLLSGSDTRISETDIDNLLAYLLADDTPTGILIVFAAGSEGQSAFGWLNGRLLHPRSVVWLETADGLSFTTLRSTERLWTVTHPDSFPALPEGNLSGIAAYIQAVTQNSSVCAVLNIPGGSGFSLACPTAGGSWQTAPGTVLFEAQYSFLLPNQP